VRYGAQTKLGPDEVFVRARKFFGEGGQLGLTEAPAPTSSDLIFAAPDGGVSVSVRPEGSRTEVTILSREYDTWAERFVREKL
jgi:hypothetical protein